MVKIYLSLCLCLLCASCTNNPSLKDDDENPHSSEGELVPIEIVLNPIADYNQQDPPATRIGIDGRTESVPILSEWVAIKKPFSAIDAPYDGPTMVAMELRQDSVTPATSDPIKTRSYLSSNTPFRLITFIKRGGNDYVFHSVGTYISGGYYSPPTLVEGKALRVPLGCTFRVVGYTFDEYSADASTFLGPQLSNYKYDETKVYWPPYNMKYFYAFNSGDQIATGASENLSLNFVSQYTQLRIKMKVTGFFDNNSNGSCKGVIHDIGCKDMSWKVGDPNGVTGTDTDIDLPDYLDDIYQNGTVYRCLPFASPKKIHIDINSIIVGHTPVKNLYFSSAEAITMKPGNSYTLTLKFQKVLGTQLKPDQMALCQPNTDKKALSKLIWADGDLIGTEDGKYEWAVSGYLKYNIGYFYTHMTRFTENTPLHVDGADDPCEQLNKATYGDGWRTPTKDEMSMLARCASQKYFGSYGRHFFSNAIGTYFLDGGYRSATEGCGKEGAYFNQIGRYATSDKDEATGKRYVLEMNGTAATNVKITTCELESGVNVRCVKDGDTPPP